MSKTISAKRLSATAIHAECGCQSGNLSPAEAERLRDALDAALKAPASPYWWIKVDGVWFGPYKTINFGATKTFPGKDLPDVVVVTDPDGSEGYFGRTHPDFLIIRSADKPTV